MNGYRSELFLHVIFVVVALGPLFVMPLLQVTAEKRNAGAVRLYLDFLERVLRMFMLPGAVLVFVMGGLLMSSDHFYGHDNPPAWLVASLLWFVVAAVFGAVGLRSTMRQARASLQGVPDEAPVPAAYRQAGMWMQVILGLLGVSVVVIAYLMVQQPGR